MIFCIFFWLEKLKDKPKNMLEAKLDGHNMGWQALEAIIISIIKSFIS